jgi:hypothetical protein
MCLHWYKTDRTPPVGLAAALLPFIDPNGCSFEAMTVRDGKIVTGLGGAATPDVDDDGRIHGFAGGALYTPGPWDLLRDAHERAQEYLDLAKRALDIAEKEYKRGYRAAKGKWWPPKPVGRPRKAN